VRDSQNFIHDK